MEGCVSALRLVHLAPRVGCGLCGATMREGSQALQYVRTSLDEAASSSTRRGGRPEHYHNLRFKRFTC